MRKPSRPLFRLSGFTLIELLVVIGLLLILTGIAVDNYLGAMVRARTSRVKADFRALATAIEVYTVDHNAVPRMASYKFYRNDEFDLVEKVAVSGVVSKVLSTPVAYISNPFRIDPFMAENRTAPLDQRLYTYQDIPAYIQFQPESKFWPKALQFYGRWRLGSVGPDQVFYHGFANSGQLPYDPTNGLLSLGNIWYAPRGGFDAMPPIPDLLGKH